MSGAATRAVAPASAEPAATRGGPKLADAIAGVSMALVLIPQALAYASVAGMPAHTGLYAAALAPLAAAFFASSPYLQTGPAAVTAIIAAGVLAAHAAPGSARYVALASVLAVIAGLIRVGIGALRGGRLVFLMSEPVLRGFTAAAALLIIASQVPAALGVVDGGRGPLGDAVAALTQPDAWVPQALLLTVLTLVVVIGARRVHPLVPGVLVATVGGTLYGALADYPGPTLGSVPEGLPRLTLDLPWGAAPSLLFGGAVIAVVGFSEAASIARVYAAREGQRWDPDREFISQGIANIAAGLGGAFPVGGSFSRSGLAHLLGARTRWSGAFTGLTVLLFLPFASALSTLPLAVLAGMVIAAVGGLLRLGPLASIWAVSRPQFGVALATYALTLALAPRIEQGVLLGILIAIVVHLWREFKVRVDAWVEGDELHVRPRGVLWFGSAEELKNVVLELVAAHPQAKRLVMRMGRLGHVDFTAALAIEDVVRRVREAGLDVTLVNVHPVTARALRAVLARMPNAPEIVATTPGDR